MSKISIYSYYDYREYLGARYDLLKKERKPFSYKAFSEMCGFKSGDFMFRVIKGEKNLGKQSLDRINEALNHTSRAAPYFEHLVKFNQAKTYEERDEHYSHMSIIRKAAIRQKEPGLISGDQYQVFNERHHLVIRSLINMYGFRDDYQWLAGMVNPPVTEAAARKSVKLLEELAFIRKDKKGNYRVTDIGMSTGDEVPAHSLHKHYRGDMEKAMEAMDRLDRSLRDITGVTVGISEKSYHIIVDRIKSLRQEIAELAQKDREADRVYAVNFHAFPLSNLKDSKKGGAK